ncbi:DegT/DnrJ/EryC1/StrS family aminotransferase [Candidatus Woesearchaeota archaeon]|nr:DegT/DnrJ/EryC1/StrS family aminotransferase [Candidatus Woesearchaeota archaeon]
MIPIAKPYFSEEEKRAVIEVLESGIIAQGHKVEEFEKKFADFCSVKYAVAVNSGTAALHAALHSMGIKKNDEVITTPFTFIATANTILMVGAKPVFADIEEDTFNINPLQIEQKITQRTKAILTVDLYGHLCDYEKISEIAKNNNLLLIEDACQSVNAQYKEKKAGSFGHIAAFSFYATKNLTCGEGGILTTNNIDYSENAKRFRQHGMSGLGAYDYNEIGYNYRMTDISAAIMLEQLKKAEMLTKKRIDNANYLNEKLKNVKGIKVPSVKKGFKHVFHQYTVKVQGFKLSRDELFEHLRKKGIGCSIYYPKPLHLCKSFAKLGYKENNLPIAEKMSKEVISLPVHPNVTKEQLDFIANSIASLG